ncbi:MAG TPA: glycosyltransferase family 2 protein [Myxococcales bacterium]
MALGRTSFSVVMPSFNQAQYLEAAILSVLDQDGPKVELLVYDGGSTDGSVDILRKHERRIAYWQSQPDGGQAQAIRDGFARATGEVLSWLNSDDLLEPGALGSVSQAFAANPQVDIVYGDLLYVEADGRPAFECSVVLDKGILAWLGPSLNQPSTFWTRTAYQRAGGVDPSFRYAMDLDLIARLMETGAQAVKLRQRLARFRLHPQQKTQQIHSVGLAEVQRIQARLRGPVANENVEKVRQRLRRFLLDPRAEWSAHRHRLYLWKSRSGR